MFGYTYSERNIGVRLKSNSGRGPVKLLLAIELKILLIREPRNCHITYQSDINGNSPIEGGIVPEKKLLLALLSLPISLAHYKFHVHTVRI